MVAHSLTYEEWIEILDLESMVSELLAGLVSPAAARLEIADRRTSLPGVPFDHHPVLAQLDGFVDGVVAAIDEQNATLDDLVDDLAGHGYSFSWDRDRLLDASQRIELEELADDIRDDANEADLLAEELDELAEAYDE